MQARTRSWVLLKHEERQEWDEKIREVISTQAPEAVICSPPFLASLPSLGSFPFFPSHCNSHSPAQPALASTVSLTPSCCPWDLPADLRLFPLQGSLCKGLVHGRACLRSAPWPHQLLTIAQIARTFRAPFLCSVSNDLPFSCLFHLLKFSLSPKLYLLTLLCAISVLCMSHNDR